MWLILLVTSALAQGMVATDHLACSVAGEKVLREGGNAVDAAVASALACGVVQPSGSGLGGGGFAVVVSADGQQRVSLDFREVAPARARRDMFVRAPRGASRKGGLSVAVPGEPAGLEVLHERWGRLEWAQVVGPAITLAEGGFVVGTHLGEAARAHEDAAVALFGRVPLPGQWVRRPTLARTLRGYASEGSASLTTGEGALDLAQAAQAAGGVLRERDLSAYQPVERAPVVGHYHGWTVISMGPPSSGGLVLLQALRVLEGVDLAALDPAERAHRLVETMKHGFADRAHYMGDPERVEVPVTALLSDERVSAIQAAYDPDHTLPPDSYGARLHLGRDGGTQHISVIDADGMAVSLTTTINTAFGSEVLAPGTGVLLNDEMDDFVARPGRPNAYGLVGSEANAVAPGARPLSSMSPTVLISPDGARRIAVGASGGPYIISGVLEVIVDLLDLGMTPEQAVAAPRVHHQWAPDRVFVDEGIDPAVVDGLHARGHTVQLKRFFSAVQVVEWGPDGVDGASDPRKGGAPAP